MEPNKPYRQLPDGRVLLDYGPMTLSVCAKKTGSIHAKAAIMGIEKALASFEELLVYLPQARQFICRLGEQVPDSAPDVYRKMFTSVRLLDDPTFTPMAAVAGSFSDVIREEILRVSDADYVVVNNGGDVSYTVPGGASFRVGIVSDIGLRQITHQLTLPPDSDTHGIATSGFGGRSLSRGIASAVTVIARTCSLADAAATDIANHTFAEDPAITTCPAEEIDYDSDIAGLTVVSDVGPIRRETVRAALENGFARAKHLCDAGMIQGAVLFVRNSFTCYPPELDILELPR